LKREKELVEKVNHDRRKKLNYTKFNYMYFRCKCITTLYRNRVGNQLFIRKYFVVTYSCKVKSLKKSDNLMITSKLPLLKPFDQKIRVNTEY